MTNARQLFFEGGILSQQGRKRTQNVLQSFPAMKFILTKKETKNIF